MKFESNQEAKNLKRWFLFRAKSIHFNDCSNNPKNVIWKINRDTLSRSSAKGNELPSSLLQNV